MKAALYARVSTGHQDRKADPFTPVLLTVICAFSFGMLTGALFEWLEHGFPVAPTRTWVVLGACYAMLAGLTLAGSVALLLLIRNGMKAR